MRDGIGCIQTAGGKRCVGWQTLGETAQECWGRTGSTGSGGSAHRASCPPGRPLSLLWTKSHADPRRSSSEAGKVD